MGLSTSISRLHDYHARNGSLSTLRRAWLAARRSLFSRHTVLFYCDLQGLKGIAPDLPDFIKLERKRSSSELASEDLQAITSFWNPDLASRNLEQRFELGASLWLLKSDAHLAGYGWTLRGNTVEAHFLPLGANDVHLFDFHVFPEYRGRGLNPLLVSRILWSLAAEAPGRAFIEAAEWNRAQLSSLTKTPFHYLGHACKSSIGRRTFVTWAGKSSDDNTLRLAGQQMAIEPRDLRPSQVTK